MLRNVTLEVGRVEREQTAALSALSTKVETQFPATIASLTEQTQLELDKANNTIRDLIIK